MTLTAGTDQDLAATSGQYRVVIRDADGDAVATCTTGTSCVGTLTAGVGAPGPFLAMVENASGGDVQATSNQAIVLDRGCAVTLSTQVDPDTVLTATVNQTLETGYEVRIVDTATQVVVRTCTAGVSTCVASLTAITGATYRADVVADAGVVASSNTATATTAAYVVTLVSSRSVVGAGETTTLTATVNQPPTGSTALLIVDNWRSPGTVVKNCGKVTSCTFDGGMYDAYWTAARVNHNWTAYVATLNGYGNLGTVTAASSPAGAVFRPWMLAVRQVNQVFPTTAAPTFEITEVGGQDVAATNGHLKALVYDHTLGGHIGVCTTTSAATPCTLVTPQAQFPRWGGAHTYRAYVGTPGDARGLGSVAYYPPTNVKFVSPAMWAARLPWTVDMSQAGNTVTVHTNQDQGVTGGWPSGPLWRSWLVPISKWPSATGSDYVGPCWTTTQAGNTCTLDVTGKTGPFLAVVGQWTGGGCAPVRDPGDQLGVLRFDRGAAPGPAADGGRGRRVRPAGAR